MKLLLRLSCLIGAIKTACHGAWSAEMIVSENS